MWGRETREAGHAGERRRPPRAEPFELADDVQQLVHVAPRQWCNRQPRLLCAWRTNDESFLL